MTPVQLSYLWTPVHRRDAIWTLHSGRVIPRHLMFLGYVLPVVLATSEETVVMETFGRVCCWVTANGDGGMTGVAFAVTWLSPALWVAAEVVMASASFPAPTMSSMLVCAIIFWRTSLIFSWRQAFVGKISKYLDWNAVVAWAAKITHF